MRNHLFLSELCSLLSIDTDMVYNGINHGGFKMSNHLNDFWKNETLVYRVALDYIKSLDENASDKGFVHLYDLINSRSFLIESYYSENSKGYHDPAQQTIILKELLAFNIEDFLLFSDLEDTKPIDIVEADMNQFTSEGKNHFNNIFNSVIREINSEGDFGFTIVLKDTTSALIEEFAYCLAGYVSLEKYNTYIINNVAELER